MGLYHQPFSHFFVPLEEFLHMYKRNYFIFPIMETVYDNNKIQHKEIVFRYCCTKCGRDFLNKKEYMIFIIVETVNF